MKFFLLTFCECLIIVITQALKQNRILEQIKSPKELNNSSVSNCHPFISSPVSMGLKKANKINLWNPIKENQSNAVTKTVLNPFLHFYSSYYVIQKLDLLLSKF